MSAWSEMRVQLAAPSFDWYMPVAVSDDRLLPNKVPPAPIAFGELDLPLIRTVETFLGYTEGWALYAERLAWELGWYADDPYGNLGRLSDEMMRAVRLVVDTGIHAMGWSFDEAVDYFVDNTGRPTSFAQGQILRYAVWPGQSTAYMVGFLTMLDLRDRVREVLGEAFDLAEYHTLILENGSLPLEILERIVDRSIEGSAAGG